MSEDDDVVRALPQSEIDRQWAEELTRRVDRALRGETVGRDGESVFAEIEAKLRAMRAER